MIWSLGKLPSADHGKTLASFVASGLQAVHDTDVSIRTMIHSDKGGDNAAARAFYDHVCDTVKVSTVIVQNSPSHWGNFPIKSGTP